MPSIAMVNQMQPLRSAVSSCLHWLAGPRVVFYALPWLLVLLTLGTISQRYIGLYHSEKLFFGSFILWLGILPLPGAYATLCFLSAGLIAKLVLKSPVRKRTFGTVITHASVLMLLLGGLVSAFSREEGYITIFRKEIISNVSDYHDREVAVMKDGKEYQLIPYTALQEYGKLPLQGVPFTVNIKQKCYPCAAVPLSDADVGAYGMAAAMELKDAQPGPDDALNRAGAMVEISGVSKEQAGRYIIFESLAEPPAIKVEGHEYKLLMRATKRALPFSVELLNFEQQNHPGTQMAREYRSEIQVQDGELKWKETVSMNQPIRYRGYTIYQSSFVDDGEKQASVLAVVKNAGWVFPYISVTLLSIGLLMHLFTRNTRKQAAAMLAALFFFGAPNAHAQQKPAFDYDAFSHIPLLHEGRIKPMESFARVLIKSMSGDKQADNATVMAWLAEVLFDPAAAADRPLFIIRSQVLPGVMGLPKSKGDRYSYSELVPALTAQQDNVGKLLKREPKSYSDSERELVRVFEMMGLYSELANSFSLFTPIDGISKELRSELKLPPEGELNFYSMLKFSYELGEKLKAIIAKKKNNISAYTTLEQDIAQLSYKLDSREAMQRYNALLRVIPGEWNNKEEWLSPWQVIARSEGSPQSAELFTLWQGLHKAWKEQDAAKWKVITTRLQAETTGAHGADAFRLALEVMYHDISPLEKSRLGYSITILLALCAVALQRRWLLTATTFSLIFTVAVHGAAILTRIMILSRPPVGTLYESMLFVSLIGALCGLYLSWKREGAEGAMAGSIIGLGVLISADVFAGDGDTLEMLTAVLNTNFWLGTHVICITAGYSFSLIVGVMAHFYLFRRAMAAEHALLAEQYKLLQTLALVALFFTTMGTMLGGIWADQSWGRFWGWDPKENGALAIVIWLAWALHGRLSGHLRETAFAATLCFTTIIVALAWVGVNLLSVGLHSYGFSNAAAWGLLMFCITEIVITGILAMLSAQQYKAIEISKARQK